MTSKNIPMHYLEDYFNAWIKAYMKNDGNMIQINTINEMKKHWGFEV